jgi:hypothetical protein
MPDSDNDRYEDQFSLDDLRVEPLERRLEFGTCGCTVCDSLATEFRDPAILALVEGQCG